MYLASYEYINYSLISVFESPATAPPTYDAAATPDYEQSIPYPGRKGAQFSDYLIGTIQLIR